MKQNQAFEKAKRTSAEDKTEVFVVWDGKNFAVVYEDEFAGDDDQIIAGFSKGYQTR